MSWFKRQGGNGDEGKHGGLAQDDASGAAPETGQD